MSRRRLALLFSFTIVAAFPGYRIYDGRKGVFLDTLHTTAFRQLLRRQHAYLICVDCGRPATRCAFQAAPIGCRATWERETHRSEWPYRIAPDPVLVP